MRILIACDQHWPMVSGVATSSRTLALALSKRGHDVLVIAPSQTGKEYEEIDQTYRIVRTKSVPFPFRQNLRISVSMQNKIKGVIVDFNPDLIHVHTQFPVGLTALRVGKKLHIPVVATNHAMPENLIENHKILQPIARPVNYTLKEYGLLLYKGAQHIIMPTQSAINMFNPESIDAPMTPVSNGIDLSYFSPGKPTADFKNRFGIPPKELLAVYVGRLDKEKHVGIFVRALAQARQHVPVHGVIVGHGNDADDLEKLVAELGIKAHMTFTGRISDEDKRQALRSGAVFIMPSPAELQSLATLEAMATGLPVIAVKAGALHELCRDGENGYLFGVDDSTDLAHRLVQILSDTSLRKRMGQKSVAIAKTHDIANVVAVFESIYKDVITRSKETASAKVAV